MKRITGIISKPLSGFLFTLYPSALRLSALCLSALCLMCLSTCQASQVQKTPPPAEEGLFPDGPDFAEARPRVAIRDELTVAFSKGDVELDFRKSFLASEAQLFTAIYEGLFSYHPFTMEPVPATAEKWEVSEDKKQWTFTIREDAKFRNGDTLKAEDFRAAWISLLSPRHNSPYSSLFDLIEGAKDYRMGIQKDPSKVGIAASGQKTLTVKLNAPASFFPAMLCHHSFSPIHPSMLGREDWSAPSSGAWDPPVSNGPFRIESMNEDAMVLLKTEQYWDARRVSLNKITIKFVEEPDKASSLWNSGEARWISGIFNWDTITDRSGIQVNPMFATHYYYIRSAEKPWNDHRVRRALVLALPWDEIRKDNGLSAKTLIVPLSGYPEIEGIYETDTEEAVKLLTQAGYPGGKGMPDLVIRISPSQDAARIGGIMASTWKEKLGIPVKVEVYPFSQYFAILKEGGYTVGSSTWIGDFADPYTFLQMWRNDSNLNDAHHNDSDYEDLMEKSMYEEGEARLATLAKAE
ncbi:MAG: peptide ABC transporter substrate-binding protein, partial [Treponema sp.]|nr:peptide ABC transporter substrate-binding protein [Treponema sp.]